MSRKLFNENGFIQINVSDIRSELKIGDIVSLYYNNRENKYYLIEGRRGRSKIMIELCRYSVATRQDIWEAASSIKNICYEDLRKHLITKTRAIKEYGKKVVEKYKPVIEIKNPHYRKAAPMQLYDIRMLQAV